MQERYCRCGQPVTVNFVLHDNTWSAVCSAHAERRDKHQAICPSCGRPLDINQLR